MKTIKIRKGLLACALMAVLWTPLLATAASMDKYADKPVWMDWTFFGNTVISAGLSRWSSREEE
ncbi:hypothetical protein [Zobellella taiwanensis]|jgi:hypothetical protein|uniref:Uncharacterized protein n=1 Tax=Zobellella taiwanensis TaxID=347535 RepID=A0A2P7QGY8_9GAMM|nr:hypothetical protein [Zobellella taiwanensis]PSJ37203.1 hypothetical protein C7I36_15840 [Zobellella taiwanensis]